MRRSCFASITVIAAGSLATMAPAVQPCTVHWSDDFPSGELETAVLSLAVFDAGSGPALYVGGSVGMRAGGLFTGAVARWDGVSFSSIGDGAIDGNVYAIAPFDDGTGSHLYVGGTFTELGKRPLNRIARLEGETWMPVDIGMDQVVWSLVVHDDGSGAALYAGGGFDSAGGVEAAAIARWDGSAWQPVGGGLDGLVLDLAVYDDGSGPALYAAGTFTSVGGVELNRIARWDGVEWSALGDGLDGAGRMELAVYDAGTGPALYVCGTFTEAGGQPAARVARWDGTAWSALGAGIDGPGEALGVYDDGSGPKLYVGGNFTSAGGITCNGIAAWDGSSWSAAGTGMDHSSATTTVSALEVFDAGSGPRLFAGGRFETAGDELCEHLASWDGTAWDSLERGMSDSGGTPVTAVIAHEPAGGLAGGIYASGAFEGAGGRRVNGVARWDGAAWSSMGDPPGIAGGLVNTLAVFDGGDGPCLYAGGDFDAIGGAAADNIARWDGAVWNALGGGVPGRVEALQVHDDGAGPGLYVGGRFAALGHISRWDGTGWTSLGDGLSGDFASVFAMTVHDDGGGPALYVGGHFDHVGTQLAVNVARWDGSSWSPLGDGLPGEDLLDGVWALASFDDGGGPALYAGGRFDRGSPDGLNGLARWDGARWTPVPGWDGGTVYALQPLDDGPVGAPALYVGGLFLQAHGATGVLEEAVLRVAGDSWSLAPGGSLDHWNYPCVFSMTAVDGALYVGGILDHAGGVSSHNIGRMITCSSVFGDIDQDADVDDDDLALLLGSWGPCPDPPAVCAADLDGDGDVSTADLLLLLAAWS